MPFLRQTPPDDLERRAKAGIANLRSRLQLPKHPVCVYVLSGDECHQDLIAASKQSLWRYYDSRDNGAYVDIRSSDLSVNSITQDRAREATVPDQIAFIERRSQIVKEDVTLRVIEVPALKVVALWELRDGISHSFHVRGFYDTVFREETPAAFHDEIEKDWKRLKAVCASHARAEALGG